MNKIDINDAFLITIKMSEKTIPWVRRFTRKPRTIEQMKLFLLHELSPIRNIYLTFKGEYRRLYSDPAQFYGKNIVRCYFPRENLCLVMSAKDSETFPIVSNVLGGAWKEEAIKTLVYHPEIKTICCGATIVVLEETDLASIVLDNGKTLKEVCVKATGWSPQYSGRGFLGGSHSDSYGGE